MERTRYGKFDRLQEAWYNFKSRFLVWHDRLTTEEISDSGLKWWIMFAWLHAWSCLRRYHTLYSQRKQYVWISTALSIIFQDNSNAHLGIFSLDLTVAEKSRKKKEKSRLSQSVENYENVCARHLNTVKGQDFYHIWKTRK